jgi:hypothetical protein
MESSPRLRGVTGRQPSDKFLCNDWSGYGGDCNVSHCVLVLENPQLEAYAVADAAMKRQDTIWGTMQEVAAANDSQGWKPIKDARLDMDDTLMALELV